MQAFYSDHFVLPLPEGHRFPMQKYGRLRDRLAADLPQVRLQQAPAASDGELALVHTPQYVAAVSEGHLSAAQQREIGFPATQYLSRRTGQPAGDGTMRAMTSPPKPESIAAADAAITSRRSVRAFLPTPVPRSTIEDILAVASRAPSGTNTQPWKVHVLTGEPLHRLSERIVAVYDDPAERAAHREEYDYYPTEWMPPYIDRRRKIGWDLYGLLGITRTDKPAMHAQHGRNYVFFDAPVGIIFTIDRVMRQGSWLDYGMFLQNVMVAARARGLDTCPQAAFMQFHRVIADELGLASSEMVVCGMSLGHADNAAIENRLVTEREPVASFARFLD